MSVPLLTLSRNAPNARTPFVQFVPSNILVKLPNVKEKLALLVQSLLAAVKIVKKNGSAGNVTQYQHVGINQTPKLWIVVTFFVLNVRQKKSIFVVAWSVRFGSVMNAQLVIVTNVTPNIVQLVTISRILSLVSNAMNVTVLVVIVDHLIVLTLKRSFLILFLITLMMKRQLFKCTVEFTIFGHLTQTETSGHVIKVLNLFRFEWKIQLDVQLRIKIVFTKNTINLYLTRFI